MLVPRVTLVVAVLVATLAAGPADAGGDAAPEPAPFPVEKTTILRDDKAVFYVEGHRRIPKNVEITVLKGIKIIGRGEDPRIEVEGRLKIQGTSDLQVEIDGVTIEPQAAFQEIRVGQVSCKTSGGIRTPPEKSCNGYFMLEQLWLANSSIDLTMSGGSIEMANVSSFDAVVIRAVDSADTKANSVRVEIRGCGETDKGPMGLAGGLTVESANEVVVRLSRLGGPLTAIRDWRKSLIFDGNKVDSTRLEITQPAAGRFHLAQLLKCDVYSEKVLFSAPPAKPKETEDVTFERFWFAKAGTDSTSVMKLVEDGSASPATNGVRAKIGKLNDRPLELGGPVPK